MGKLLKTNNQIIKNNNMRNKNTTKTQQKYLHSAGLETDLVYFTEHSMVGGIQIKHPFCFSHITTGNKESLSTTIKMANTYYLAVKEEWEKYKVEGGLGNFISYRVELPYRLHFLVNHQDKLTDKEYWETLGGIFLSTENQTEDMSKWIELLNNPRPKRECLMYDIDDYDFFEGLPDKVEVWRGVSDEDYVDGLSWSTEKGVAEWFAKRHPSGERILCNGWIEKDKILMSSIHEHLIVCNPNDITDLNTEKIILEDEPVENNTLLSLVDMAKEYEEIMSE
jgi:hypothetical protein